jgi:hypothetical protein
MPPSSLSGSAQEEKRREEEEDLRFQEKFERELQGGGAARAAHAVATHH